MYGLFDLIFLIIILFDRFAYKYGSGFLASLAAVSGIYINNYYRRKFMLHSYGRVSSFLPIAVLPACLSLLSHIQVHIYMNYKSN